MNSLAPTLVEDRVADHWCSMGHVTLCLSGSLEISLKDVQQPSEIWHESLNKLATSFFEVSG